MNEKTNLPSADEAMVSLDEQIKREQLAKLKAEVRGLTGWSFDSIAKLTIGILAILAAAWTFYLGLPKAQIDLRRALDDVASQQKKLKENDDKVEEQLVAIAQKNELIALMDKQIAVRNDQIQLKQDALDSVKSGAAPTAAGQAKIAAATRPNVFVQFAGELTRAQVDALRADLGRAGFNAPPAERINRGQKNEVRYFTDSAEEKERAERAATATQAFLEQKDCVNRTLETRFVPLPDGRQSPVEVWLMNSCKG